MAKLFFSGIGGSGVSAIAGFMADKGHAVTGSDRLFDSISDHPVSRVLKAKGIKITPQDGSGIDTSLDCAVFSTAIEPNHPELKKITKLNIPVMTRPQYLRVMVSAYRTIAVAGTSGKSTTAGMLAYLMRRLGMSPNFIGGGRVKQFRDHRNLGNSLVGGSDIFIFEACESDGTIVSYSPFYSIIASLNLDHNPIIKTGQMFEILGRNTRGKIIVNGDDENLARCRFDNPVFFSKKNDSQYRAEKIAYHAFGTDFQVHSVPFHLPLPGKHNLYNALACIAVLTEMGVHPEDIAAVMPGFSGIDRRFDIHLRNDRHLVIDDYAHNPHKIASLMETVKNIGRRVCYIFQPHGYGPTRLMKNEYIEVFANNLQPGDHLLMLPIYYAGGTSIKDVSSEDLCADIKLTGKNAEVLPERSLLFSRLNEWDTYVVFGARDESLSDFAREIAERLQ